MQIGLIFNVLDLYKFEGFNEEEQSTVVEQVGQLLTKQDDIVQEGLDVKEMTSRRGITYRRFLIKWLGKPACESTWISEEQLRKVDLEMCEEAAKVFSKDITNLSTRGE